jgi:alkylation response protein AidB-like acyl-CoA dehydrogenase
VVDFDFGAKSLEYKAEARAFIAEELTPERVEQVHATGTYYHPDFHQALVKRGWLAPGWPVEFGGRGLDPMDVVAFTEELAEAGAPTYAASTTMMIAGVLREIGTEQQKAAILPQALGGEIIIVLGFTEPDCGSDVAAVATRAVRDGDDWVINGSKMFTTNAHVADYVFLLARTDPDVPKHKGLTTFLVPLNQPGVSFQPVMTMSGERTNVTFYDDVRVADSWRIGGENRGWETMSVALTLERTNATGGDHRRLVAAAERWAASAAGPTGQPLLDDPSVRVRLARAATETRVARLLGLRSVWIYAQGGLPGVEGSMAKLFASEALVRMADDLALLAPDGLRRDDPAHGGELEHAVCHAQATTIYGGTSEVQRSIIAQRGLGLPRPT